MRVGHIVRSEFGHFQTARGWTNRRKLVSRPTAGGEKDLCSYWQYPLDARSRCPPGRNPRRKGWPAPSRLDSELRQDFSTRTFGPVSTGSATTHQGISSAQQMDDQHFPFFSDDPRRRFDSATSVKQSKELEKPLANVLIGNKKRAPAAALRRPRNPLCVVCLIPRDWL